MYDRSRTVALAVALTLPAVAASAGPIAAANAPASDADALALTQATVLDLHAGHLERSRLTPTFAALLQGARLAGLSRPFERLSPPFELALQDRADRDGVTTRTYVLSAREGDEFVTVGLDDATGKIGALYARPGPPR